MNEYIPIKDMMAQKGQFKMPSNVFGVNGFYKGKFVPLENYDFRKK